MVPQVFTDGDFLHLQTHTKQIGDDLVERLRFHNVWARCLKDAACRILAVGETQHEIRQITRQDRLLQEVSTTHKLQRLFLPHAIDEVPVATVCG